jgi:hypothetical protein
MTDLLLVEFSTVRGAIEAARAACEAGRPPDDVLAPVPVEGVAGYLAPPRKVRPIGWVMFIAGVGGAVIGWFMQWYSAVIAYPTNSGGRPLNSWPAFLLVPYETTILAAGIVGLLGWMWMCGLPKLFHPLFAAPAAERAVQDKLLLVFPLDDAIVSWVQANLKPDAMHEIRE